MHFSFLFLICLRFSNNAVVIPSTSTTEVALGSISSMEFCCSISPIETISKKKLLFLSKSNTTIAQGDVLLNTQTVLLPQGETLKNYKIELTIDCRGMSTTNINCRGGSLFNFINGTGCNIQIRNKRSSAFIEIYAWRKKQRRSSKSQKLILCLVSN